MASNFGEWSIQENISTGGQGHVHKAVKKDGTIGALKRLKNPRRLDRFKSEIDAALKLQHPNIVPLLDTHIDEDPFYAVYEYEPGGSLSSLPLDELQSIPLTMRLGWCEDIALALHAAHEASIIHRDVKPDNILLSADRTKARLCDFGLVYMDGDERITETVEQVGSRYYIPPECEDGRADEVSRKADLYSLGKVLYYLASGGKIFAREKHRQDKYELSKVMGDAYLEAVSAILDKVITDSPADRLESALEFRAILSQARFTIENQIPCRGVFETYRCLFCREGTYKQICISGRSEAHNAGYGEGNIGQEYMVYMECQICGNCQRFKLKYGGEEWFPAAYGEYRKRMG